MLRSTTIVTRTAGTAGSNRTVRRVTVAAALAAALTLAGCSNSDQGAQSNSAGSSSNVVAPASQASASGAASSDAVGSADSSGNSAASNDSAAASAGASGSESATAGESAGVEAMTPTSEAPSSRAPKPTPSSPAPSGTATVGNLSAADSSWFDAMCSGLGGGNLRTEFAALKGDLDSRKTAAAKLLTDQADRMESAASAMKSKPAPSVAGGDKLAPAVIDAYVKGGQAARAGAQSLAAAGSDDELQAAFDKARDEVNSAASGLDAFDEMMGAPAMVAQLKKVPSCASLVG